VTGDSGQVSPRHPVTLSPCHRDALFSRVPKIRFAFIRVRPRPISMLDKRRMLSYDMHDERARALCAERLLSAQRSERRAVRPARIPTAHSICTV